MKSGKFFHAGKQRVTEIASASGRYALLDIVCFALMHLLFNQWAGAVFKTWLEGRVGHVLLARLQIGLSSGLTANRLIANRASRLEALPEGLRANHHHFSITRIARFERRRQKQL